MSTLRTPWAARLGLLAILAVLAGCQVFKPRVSTAPTAWTRAGVTPEQLSEDRSSCLRKADRKAGADYVTTRQRRERDNLGRDDYADVRRKMDRYAAERDRDRLFGNCMRRLGYVPVREAQEKEAKPK